MFFGPFVALGSSWQTFQNGLTSAAQAREVLDQPIEKYHPENAQTSLARSGSVVFENVSFGYADGNQVLSNISFEVLPGQSIALVGQTGVGKSTLISLISGFYFPTAGSARVDGVETRRWDLSQLRSGIAVVPQEVALFNDTIEANIKYGSFGASRDLVEHAAREAHIDEFIETLPNKYQTIVGERGIKLSVGQKQRVAIARAILRDPEILVLDEPTSALDSITEKQVTESLSKLMKGRTTFIIAHRLSTVRHADVILVLENGRVLEKGNHAELIKINNGHYRRLYEYQIGLHE
jgi:ABC-type multidrug transport system fused ATPase/permease subunit